MCGQSLEATNDTVRQYVTEGYMKVEPHEARIDHGRIVTIVTPEEFEEFRIVILSGPKKLDDSKKDPPEGQTGYVANLSEVGTILLASTFVEEGGRRFVWIAKGQDNLKRLVDDSPADSSIGLYHYIWRRDRSHKGNRYGLR